VGDAEDGSRWVFGGIIAAVAGKREALAYSAREESPVEEQRQQELFLSGSGFGNEKRPLICHESPMGELLLSFEMTAG
jgi:hypothetical protein